MSKEKISIILLLLFSIPCFAEDNSIIRDTLNDKSIRIGYKMPMFDFGIQDSEEKGESIDYTANTPLTFSASFYYKSLGISVSKELVSAEDDSQYGKTKYTDIQLNYSYKSYGCEVFYQKYQGYYLDNYDKFGYSKNSPETIRPDIKTQNIGLNIFRVFSKSYTPNAVLNQVVRQKKWTKSFLLMAAFNQFKLKSDNNLIPSSQAIYYGDNASYSGGVYNVITVAPGIAGTLPRHNYYISGVCFAGYGMSFSENDYLIKTVKAVESFIKVNIKFGVGYNGKKFFTGIAASLDGVTPMKSGDEVEFQTYSGYVDLFFGIRF